VNESGQGAVEASIGALVFCLLMIGTLGLLTLAVAQYWLRLTAFQYGGCLSTGTPAALCQTSARSYAAGFIPIKNVSVKSQKGGKEMKVAAMGSWLGVKLRAFQEMDMKNVQRTSNEK